MAVMRRILIAIMLIAALTSSAAATLGKYEFLCGKTFVTFPGEWVEGAKTPTRGLITIRKAHILSLQRWVPGASATVIFRIGGKAKMRIMNLPEPDAVLLFYRLVTCLD